MALPPPPPNQGLPPTPPSIASNLVAINDHAYPANNKDNNGSLVKPLGVNVPRRNKNRFDRSVLTAIVVSCITDLVICASITWVLVVRYRHSAPQLDKEPPTPLSPFIKPSGAKGFLGLSGAILIQVYEAFFKGCTFIVMLALLPIIFYSLA